MITMCAVCGGEIRRDIEHYDQPRWVHVHLADTVTCLEPGDIRPAVVPTGTGWPVT